MAEMKKMRMSLFALIAALILFSSSSMEMVSVVQAQGVTCMDSCSTGCVNRDSRLQSRCERKCQIKCDNNAFMADQGHA